MHRAFSTLGRCELVWFGTRYMMNVCLQRCEGLFWIYNVVGCSCSEMPTALMTHSRINADLLVCPHKKVFCLYIAKV